MAMVTASCATGRGTLFREVVEPDGGGEPADSADNGDGWGIIDDEAVDNTVPGIRIETDPAGAAVYLNRKFVGNSPLSTVPDSGGTYLLRVEKDGYYGEEAWITWREDSLLVIRMDLELITGYLSIRVRPSGALVTLNGSQSAPGVQELPVGAYSLRIRSFGYRDWTGRVIVGERATTAVNVALETADFEVSGLRLSRPWFNPGNPGSLGTIRGTFEVTASGNGTVTIYDGSGRPVRSSRLGPFETWEQSFTWDGSDSEGRSVPDGEYAIELETAGDGDDSSYSYTIPVRVDSTAEVTVRSSWSGTAGVLFTPTPDVLPPATLQVSAVAAGHIESTASGDTLSRFPVQVALRFGLPESLELVLQGTVVPQTSGAVPFSAGASLKYRIPVGGDGPFAAAVYGKGTYMAGETVDVMTNYGGLSFGTVGSVEGGSLALAVAPELILSWNGVDYPGDGFTALPGFTIWGYGRLGLLFDTGSFMTGLSAAFRTLPFSGGFGLHLPLELGWELHWVVPSTQIVLSLITVAEIAGPDNFYLSGGGGIGIVN